MSDGLVNVDNLCTNPENHKIHICQLLKTGKVEEVAGLQTTPRFICNNCGQKSNVEGAVCAPGPFRN